MNRYGLFILFLFMSALGVAGPNRSLICKDPQSAFELKIHFLPQKNNYALIIDHGDETQSLLSPVQIKYKTAEDQSLANISEITYHNFEFAATVSLKNRVYKEIYFDKMTVFSKSLICREQN